MSSAEQQKRRTRLGHVATRYRLHAGLKESSTAVSQMAEWLHGDRIIGQWAVVTVSTDGHHVDADSGDLEEAREAAVRWVGDEIYPQFPVCLVNLDTGEILDPAWSFLTWEPRS